MSSLQDLKTMIRAKMPIIHVLTHDENRCIRDIASIIDNEKKKEGTLKDVSKDKLKRDLFFWSVSQGMKEYVNEESFLDLSPAKDHWEKSDNPRVALASIAKHGTSNNRSIYIMRDMNTVLVQPIIRQLRDMYDFLIDNSQTIIIVSSQLVHGTGSSAKGMDGTIEKQINLIHWDLPTRPEIETILREYITEGSANPELKSNYTDDEYFKFSKALQGLTHLEIINSATLSMAEKNELDFKVLLKEKKQIIKRSDILEFIESNETMNDVGGLDVLKEFIKVHTDAHSEEAEAFGVDPPKGILLLGIPGVGKSLAARVLGNQWSIPTLRLDVGKVMSGLVGSSEERMRQVIATAQSVAPAVLWIDEIEKALSGTKSSNHSDGGTLSRVFGTLLTAMQEGLKGITLVATANDISMLPPELIRRFSETFFVAGPVESERSDIFAIHLKKKKRDPKTFDLETLAKACPKFTGAEIEKVIKESIARCYNDGKRNLADEDILLTIKNTKPLAYLMKDEIDKTIEWARDRAKFASSLAAKELAPGKQSITTKAGKKIDLNGSLEEEDEKTTKKRSRLDTK